LASRNHYDLRPADGPALRKYNALFTSALPRNRYAIALGKARAEVSPAVRAAHRLIYCRARARIALPVNYNHSRIVHRLVYRNLLSCKGEAEELDYEDSNYKKKQKRDTSSIRKRQKLLYNGFAHQHHRLSINWLV